MEAAAMAKKAWCRVTANMSLGAYEIVTANSQNAPPWPDLPFQDLLRIAFGDRYISDHNHPILKRLRGEL